MTTIRPALTVGKPEPRPDWVLTADSRLSRLRLWWMCRRGEVASIGLVDGKQTYLALDTKAPAP